MIDQRLALTLLAAAIAAAALLGAYKAVGIDVYIFIGSQVGRDPETTTRILVKTGLRVSARSPAFASTTTSCTTTGELERRIHSALQAELGRSP